LGHIYPFRIRVGIGVPRRVAIHPAGGRFFLAGTGASLASLLHIEGGVPRQDRLVRNH